MYIFTIHFFLVQKNRCIIAFHRNSGIKIKFVWGKKVQIITKKVNAKKKILEKCQGGHPLVEAEMLGLFSPKYSYFYNIPSLKKKSVHSTRAKIIGFILIQADEAILVNFLFFFTKCDSFLKQT